MSKLLPIGIVIILIIAVGLLFFRNSSFSSQPKPTQSLLNLSIPADTSAQTIDDRVKNLEVGFATLVDEIKKIEKGEIPALSGNQSSAALEERVRILEIAVNDLKNNVGISTTAPTSTPIQTQSQPDIFIPFCADTNTQDANWTYTEINCDISLNPNDFSGYSSIQLEGDMRLTQIVGTFYVRLYNVTDSSAVSSSDMSTTADSYTLVSSSKFNLAPGTKTYRLQLKSSSNTQAIIKNARLRVNF